MYYCYKPNWKKSSIIIITIIIIIIKISGKKYGIYSRYTSRTPFAKHDNWVTPLGWSHDHCVF